MVTVEPAGSPVRLTGTIRTVGSAPDEPTAVWQPDPGACQLSGSITAGQRYDPVPDLPARHQPQISH